MAVVPGMARVHSAPADLAAPPPPPLGCSLETVEIAYRREGGGLPGDGSARTFAVPRNPARSGRTAGSSPRRGRRRPPDPSDPPSRTRGDGGPLARGEMERARYYGARSVAVYLAMPKALAAVFRSARLTAMAEPVGRRVVGQGDHRPVPGGPPARPVEARFSHDAARCVVEGHDLYGVTAAACSEAAQRLTASPDPPAREAPPRRCLRPGHLPRLPEALPHLEDPAMNTCLVPPPDGPPAARAGSNATSTPSASTCICGIFR